MSIINPLIEIKKAAPGIQRFPFHHDFYPDCILRWYPGFCLGTHDWSKSLPALLKQQRMADQDEMISGVTWQLPQILEVQLTTLILIF